MTSIALHSVLPAGILRARPGDATLPQAAHAPRDPTVQGHC